MIHTGETFTIRNRLRRNRRSESIRLLLEETELRMSDLIAPFFLIEGTKASSIIDAMPGIYRLSIDLLLGKIEKLVKKGVRSIALFPTVEPSQKSELAEEAWNSDNLISRAIREVKQHFPEICLIADVALDPYTTHGHDGLVKNGKIVNDPTIAALIRQALSQAEAGIDYVAPSDMMDGRVGEIRKALDENGFEEVGILSYSAKYASSLYAPFRDALHVELQYGDKKTYQLNPANSREALLEAEHDDEEGADILMVKPALYYLDIISKLREQTKKPIAAYHVSGEYSMVMAAAAAGYLDPHKVFREALLSIKRAGADMIFTYAIDFV